MFINVELHYMINLLKKKLAVYFWTFLMLFQQQNIEYQISVGSAPGEYFYGAYFKNGHFLIFLISLFRAVTVDSFKACFPYEHNYADAIQNEFVTLWKWLKLIHKKKKAPFTVNSPLPSDLYIQLREFLFEMSDDTFEVKLRDNYELLEDEYKESLKRQKMLDAKVAELSKTHLLSMTSEKIEELYASLNKKNAEIYVQRSKQMNKQSPPRTRLLAWMMTDVQIMSLADPTLHGAENVVRIMTEIDPDR